MSEMATAALMYDFDRTLCTKDMQEYTFIPQLGISAGDFWREANALSSEKKMDPVLAYMYLMIKKATAAERPIRRDDFVAAGEKVEFFPGIPEWFERINRFGTEIGLKVEHYIISSGLKEIIEGSGIAGDFAGVFASEFKYDANNVAEWPLAAINYTAKTQFLFRINKGILDISENSALNKYTPEEARPVPFSHMIYIGDGLTDVPCMKLVKVNGGKSIAVHQEEIAIAQELLHTGRVDFIAPADYRCGTVLDVTVHEILSKIAADSKLSTRHSHQINSD